MKLKNLLFATMIACAFASCSNDDDPINDGGNKGDTKADATLSLIIKKNEVTKALPDADAANTDGNIKDLMIAIFNNGAYTEEGFAEDALVLTAKANTDEITAKKVEDIAVRAGGVKVLVLVNVGTTFDNLGTLAAFQEKIYSIQSILERDVDLVGLPMSSDVISLNLLAGKNYLGYSNAASDDGTNLGTTPVGLYRTVSRIKLGTVTIAIADEDKEDYIDAEFTFKDFFLMNAKTNSSIFALASRTNPIWGGSIEVANSYYCGTGMGSFTGENGLYAANKSDQYYMRNVSPVQTLNAATPAFIPKEIKRAFYVAENTNGDNPTILVLHGSFSYKTSTGKTVNIPDTYYTVAVNKEGLSSTGSDNINYDNAFKHAGIFRNMLYTVNITIKGAGSKEPSLDGTSRLFVQVNVVDEGSVIHNADRE